MSEFLREKDCPVICFDAPERLAIPAPRFLGSQPGGGESFTLETAGFVEIKPLKLEIAEIADAVVIGGTNFMLANGCAVHPDLYLAEREVCPAETFGVATVRPDEQQITIYMRRGTRNVERAISLLGQCTGNYAHWLTETLPKLLIADMFPQYDGLPLLIDGWIHPVFYETVDVLGKQKREIIRIGRWRAVKLGSVVSVSPTAYIPAEYREFVTTGKLIKLRSDEFKFSQRALELLRDKAHEVIAPRAGAPSRWLYLHRDSCGNGRRVIGAEQIEELARHFGFDIIEPGTMKFVDQVQAFRNAEIIMAPLGAALTNAIFSPPGCKVIAIAPYFAGANYDYYAQFMGLLGHDLYYVLGPQTHHGIHPLHRDYHADIVALRLVLQKICSQFSKCPAQPAAALHSS